RNFKGTLTLVLFSNLCYPLLSGIPASAGVPGIEGNLYEYEKKPVRQNGDVYDRIDLACSYACGYGHTPAGAFSLPYVSGNGVSGAQNSEDYPGNDTESRKAGPIDRRDRRSVSSVWIFCGSFQLLCRRSDLCRHFDGSLFVHFRRNAAYLYF